MVLYGVEVDRSFEWHWTDNSVDTGVTGTKCVSFVETVITKHTAATTRTLLHRSIGIKAFLLLERYQSTKYIKTSNLH